MSADLIQRGSAICNEFNRETFVFAGRLDDPSVAAFDVVLAPGGSGGGNAVEHIHPCADEHFTVRSGRIHVVVDGVPQVVEAGGHAVVPRGRRHYFANAGEGDAEITIGFSPAQQHTRFFANFALLTSRRRGWFSAKGEPRFLLIALILNAYRDHLYLAGIPVGVQKVLFAVLAPVAWLLGYRLEIAPAPAHGRAAEPPAGAAMAARRS